MTWDEAACSGISASGSDVLWRAVGRYADTRLVGGLTAASGSLRAWSV